MYFLQTFKFTEENISLKIKMSKYNTLGKVT